MGVQGAGGGGCMRGWLAGRDLGVQAWQVITETDMGQARVATLRTPTASSTRRLNRSMRQGPGFRG